jgi:hypothetical protein
VIDSLIDAINAKKDFFMWIVNLDVVLKKSRVYNVGWTQNFENLKVVDKLVRNVEKENSCCSDDFKCWNV